MKRAAVFLILIPLWISCGSQARDPDSQARTLLNRADEAFLDGDYARAQTLFQQYLHSYPDIPEAARAHQYSGKCNLAMGKVRDGLSDLQRALELTRDDLLKLRIYETLSRGYKQNGEPARAAASLDPILSAPRSLADQVMPRPELMLQLGLLSIRAAEWDRGREVLEMLVREFPSSDEARRAREKMSFTDRRFFVQLGAFKDPGHAEEQIKDLNGRGISSHLKEAVLSDGHQVYWVLTGGYGSWDEAAREAERLKQKGIDALVVP